MKKGVRSRTKRGPPIKRTNWKIVVTAIVALACIVFAFLKHWAFIIPAVILWWINKRTIKKHFGV
jgi:hypothetical protein